MNSLCVMGECRSVMFGDIEEMTAFDKELEVILAKIQGLFL